MMLTRIFVPGKFVPGIEMMLTRIFVPGIEMTLTRIFVPGKFVPGMVPLTGISMPVELTCLTQVAIRN